MVVPVEGARVALPSSAGSSQRRPPLPPDPVLPDKQRETIASRALPWGAANQRTSPQLPPAPQIHCSAALPYDGARCCTILVSLAHSLDFLSSEDATKESAWVGRNIPSPMHMLSVSHFMVQFCGQCFVMSMIML